MPLLLLFSLTGCGLLGIGGGGDPDEEITEEGEPIVDAATPSLPATSTGTVTNRQFFEVKKRYYSIEN